MARSRSASGLALASALALTTHALAPLPAAGTPAPFDRGELYVASWGVAEGLPQGTINDIVEDVDGELWLATFGGLVSFDGLRFEVYDLATLPDLPSSRITALAAAPGGGLWLATQTGFVARFAGGRISDVVEVDGQRTEVVALTVSSAGDLFVRTSPGDVFRIEGGRSKRVLQTERPIGFHTLRGVPGGGIWASSRNALYRVDDGARFEMPGNVVDLTPDDHGGLWLGLEDGLAHFADGSGHRVGIFPPIEGPVTAILPEGEGRIWVAARRSVLELERQADGTWRRVSAPLDLPDGDEIRALRRDAAGSLWLGRNGGGLSRITEGPFSRIPVSGSPSAVTALASDGAGGAWLAANCTELTHLTANGEKLEVKLPPDADEGSGCEFALALDTRERLWVSARAHLFRIERATGGREAGAVTRLPVRLPDEPGKLVADPDGSLWIASRNGRVERLGPDEKLEVVAELGELLSSAVRDPQGGLWVGSWGAIYRLHGGRVEHFGEAQELPRGAVRAILPMRPGKILIGTYGGGLGLRIDGVWKRITTAQGLLDNSISALLEDSRERIWVLSNRGISMIEAADLAAFADGRRAMISPVDFGSERGIPEGNFGSPSAFRDADRLWFGTVAGAVTIDAATFPRNRVPPRVHVEAVWIDGAPAPLSPLVEIPAGTGRVRLDFTTFSRGAPARVRFRQRVQGLDHEWVDLADRRTGGFTPTQPGDYLFRVEARNEDGVWSEQPAEVSFRVLPAWWQWRSIRVAGIVLLAAALWIAHRLRLSAIDRRSRVLLQEISERHRAEVEAARLRNEIEHVSRLATAGELATSLAHEVNQPLAAIVSNAQAGRRFLAQGEEGRAEVDQIFGDIARQGQRASEVIQRLREFLRKEKSQRTELDLNELVRGVLPLVRREIEDRSVGLKLDLEPRLPRVLGDRVQLQQVAVNLIQNACDAMESSPMPRRLALASRSDDHHVELTITDSGSGVAPELAATIFEPFVSTKSGGMGMGLSICRSLAESHGGTLKLEESPEGGARFRLRLPVAAGAERSA